MALLAHFSRTKGITYPLLSDPDSKVIRAFGILNDNFPPDHLWYGVPFPGTFVIDERGIVRAKYFEQDHRDRYTAASIFVRHAPSGTRPDGTEEITTRHLKLVSWASDSVVRPGNRVTLVLDIELQPGMHVYAPGVQGGYIPIEWKLPDMAGWLAHPVEYPPARMLHLAAIEETVPVYEGRLRLRRDLNIGQAAEIKPFLTPAGELPVEGSLRYQACDDKMCYPPQVLPLRWRFKIEPHDSTRAPEPLRRPSRR